MIDKFIIRGINMKKIISITLVIYVLFFNILMAKSDIKGEIDIDKLSSKAKRTDAHIMIFLHKDYCGFCEKMEKNIASNLIKQEIKKSFILLSLNIDRDEIVLYQNFKGSIHKFAKEFGISLYPTLIFIDEENKAIYSVVGFRKQEELLDILKFVSSKSYKEMDFDTFQSDLEFQE